MDFNKKKKKTRIVANLVCCCLMFIPFLGCSLSKMMLDIGKWKDEMDECWTSTSHKFWQDFHLLFLIITLFLLIDWTACCWFVLAVNSRNIHHVSKWICPLTGPDSALSGTAWDEHLSYIHIWINNILVYLTLQSHNYYYNLHEQKSSQTNVYTVA